MRIQLLGGMYRGDGMLRVALWSIYNPPVDRLLMQGAKVATRSLSTTPILYMPFGKEKPELQVGSSALTQETV